MGIAQGGVTAPLLRQQARRTRRVRPSGPDCRRLDGRSRQQSPPSSGWWSPPPPGSLAPAGGQGVSEASASRFGHGRPSAAFEAWSLGPRASGPRLQAPGWGARVAREPRSAGDQGSPGVPGGPGCPIGQGAQGARAVCPGTPQPPASGEFRRSELMLLRAARVPRRRDATRHHSTWVHRDRHRTALH